MTGVCGGGTSSSITGFNATVYASAAVLANLMLNKASKEAAAFAGLLAAKTYELTSFCNGDPPALVVPTALQFAEFLNVFDPVANTAAASAVQRWVDYYAWFAFCKCDAGAQPAPTAPVLPSGTPQINPPIPNPQLEPCATGQSAPTACSSDLSNSAFFGGSIGAPPPPPVVFPAGATWVQFTAQNLVNGTHPDSIDFTFYPYATMTGSGGAGTQFTVPSGGTVVRTWQIPAGSAGFGAECGRHTGGSNNSNLAVLSYQVFCGGQPGQTTSPCCPPDPQIDRQLQQLLAMVTLIQRQAVPFAYVPGTVHAGLSGAGSFAISGLIGVKINVTTLPPQLGQEGTSPTEYFDMGFITFGTADGYPASYRLEHSPQVLLPARCSAYTQLAYDLHPSVVVTITELLREP